MFLLLIHVFAFVDIAVGVVVVVLLRLLLQVYVLAIVIVIVLVILVVRVIFVSGVEMKSMTRVVILLLGSQCSSCRSAFKNTSGLKKSLNCTFDVKAP